MIVLEGLATAVIAVAVGFYHESRLPPEEIHLVRTDANVDLRSWKLTSAAELQEISLQIAASGIAVDP